jgi:hypothetical protein
MRSLNFSIDLIFPVALWVWDRLSLQYKLTPGILLEIKGDQHVRLITTLLSVSRLTRKCESLDVSQPYWISLSLTDIVLFSLEIVSPFITSGK